jgi:hypothetical protein
MEAGDADIAEVPSEYLYQMNELTGEWCALNTETSEVTCEVVNDSMPFRVYIGYPIGRYYTQRWMQGMILNPAFEGNYYYTIYKD